MTARTFFSLILLSVVLLFPEIVNGQPEFVTDDRIYSNNVRTALLYPYSGNVYGPLSPPIVSIDQTTPLMLEFDELGTTTKNYYVKIIHCNADWSVSTLTSINYLENYNEFFISDRRSSVGTRIPYIHYKFTLPPVKIGGNYVVKVYRDYNEEDLALSKRFSVYENLAGIFPTVKFSTDPSVRNSKQQIDFNIDYSRIDIVDPAQFVQVVLRQNFRWDNAIKDLKPVVVNEEVKNLEYYYFNQENNFNGLNEYRLFEMKSSMYSGFNVMRVRRDSSKSEAFLFTDKNRAREAYVQPLIADFDGRFYVQNQETGDNEFMADYMYATFSLESDAPMNGKVYVFGGLSEWALNKNFEMLYKADEKKYTCQVLLKQGVYNYSYVLANPSAGKIDETYFEGNYSITQNNYDILVYYRPFGSRADKLIGYKNVNYNARK